MKAQTGFLDIVAGPCSAESREQVMETALQLKTVGIKTFRAGLWKPRSRCGTFEGVGVSALPWLNEVQKMYGMKVTTEVALPAHVDAALKAGIDILWIGARTTVNPFMMFELAESLRGCSVPVFVKNPVCPDLTLWKGGIDRLCRAGVNCISLIHRGFCLEDNTPYRNTPLWDFVDRIRVVFPDFPLYCDPSHIAGRRELLPELCKKALDYNYHGLFIESHCAPDKALSDVAQQITPNELNDLMMLL